ncbi:uncharacterized [Tachysurus ichikawai]
MRRNLWPSWTSMLGLIQTSLPAGGQSVGEHAQCIAPGIGESSAVRTRTGNIWPHYYSLLVDLLARERPRVPVWLTCS